MRALRLRSIVAASLGMLLVITSTSALPTPARSEPPTPRVPAKHPSTKPKPAVKPKPKSPPPNPKTKARPAKNVRGAAKHVEKRPRITNAADWASAPSARYGAMSLESCHRELGARQIGFAKVDGARGVEMPVRLTGPLGGVSFHTELPVAQRKSSPWEVYDCRLVLALEDWSKLLVARDIDEVVIFSAWRPPGAAWPADKHATRHPGALAVDVKHLLKKVENGPKQDLVVVRDWSPARNADGCVGDVSPNTDAARELRAIWCEAIGARLFTTMLGPNYNAAHENHFHLEVTPDVNWRLTL